MRPMLFSFLFFRGVLLKDFTSLEETVDDSFVPQNVTPNMKLFKILTAEICRRKRIVLKKKKKPVKPLLE